MAKHHTKTDHLQEFKTVKTEPYLGLLKGCDCMLLQALYAAFPLLQLVCSCAAELQCLKPDCSCDI
jgi:hypothetical protein